MKPQPIQTYNPTFGILKTHRKTAYGDYMQGFYKGYNIEVFNATKHNQKLIYVSDKFLNWIKSKLFYIQDGMKKVIRSERLKNG